MSQGPQGSTVIAAEWILLTTVLLIISARLYLRLRITRQALILSDAFVILAFCTSVMSASFDITFLQLGILKPGILTSLSGLTDLSVIQTTLKYFWASNFPFFTTFYLCKASILAFYLQIFPPHLKLYRFLLYSVIGFTVVAYTVSVCVALFLCFPVQRQWDLSLVSCSSETPANIFLVAWSFNFSSDILIFVLPFLIISRLQLRRLAKISVYCTFGLGIINIAFSLARFLTIQLASDGAVSLTLVELWSALDSNIGLIIACLPSLRPYLKLLSKGSSLSNRYTAATSGNTNFQHTKMKPSTSIATGGFTRIDDSNERCIRVCTTVEQYARPDTAASVAEMIGTTAWDDPVKTSTGTAVKVDETASEIELIPWPEDEPGGGGGRRSGHGGGGVGNLARMLEGAGGKKQ